MQKITLSIKDIYSLDNELKGVRNDTGVILLQGLLQQKLPIVVKYWVSDLSKKLDEIKKGVEEIRLELFHKYGKISEDGKSLKIKDDESKEKLQNEHDELFNQTREIEVYHFKLFEFGSIETSDHYDIFFRLISPE